MQNKIGFVGVGQCGSNIAQLFEHLNYTCVCINSSEKDFKPLNTKYNYCTPKTDGCNHDRKKAITILQKYYKNILKEIIDKLYDKELIYFIFSTGGGTGSGFSPVLIELLNQEFQEKFPSQDKTICAIPVLPSTEEKSPQVQFNSYECYKSLSQIENLGTVFTLDNSKMNKFTLNKTFVSLFHTMLSIPDHTHTSGNIDTAELFKLLKQRGNAIITSFPTSQNLVPDIIKSWSNTTVFAPISKDKNIIYLTLSLTKELTDQQYTDLEKYIGTWTDKYSNINPDQNITMLTGLTFPIERIKQIVDLCKKDKDTILTNKNNALTNKIDIEFDLFSNQCSSLYGSHLFEAANADNKVVVPKDFNTVFSKFL